MAVNDHTLKLFKALLHEHQIEVSRLKDIFLFTSDERKIEMSLPPDLLRSAPQKLVAVIRSRLLLNQRVFARNCRVERIAKPLAEKFLNQYHIMNSASCAFGYGLFLKDELLAVATFSKGRKLDRLPEHLRSFELIRFCCKDGVTITGGLSKLVRTFCKEKNAGDVMTYIDPQFSQGGSYLKAGFKKLEDASANKHHNLKLFFAP